MYKIISIFFILISFSTFAEGITILFEKESETTFKTGESFIAKMLVYPREEIQLEDLTVLENKRFQGILISDLMDMKLNDNNSDVIEAKALLTYLGKDGPNLNLAESKIGNQYIKEIKYKNISLVEEKVEQIQDFNIVEQDFSPIPKSLKILFAILLLIIIVPPLILRKKIKKIWDDKKALKIKMKKWQDLKPILSNASDRKDFEAIYGLRKSWIDVHVENNPQINSFLKLINKYQYLPEWDEHIINEITSEYQEFKHIIEQTNGV